MGTALLLLFDFMTFLKIIHTIRTSADSLFLYFRQNKKKQKQNLTPPPRSINCGIQTNANN